MNKRKWERKRPFKKVKMKKKLNKSWKKKKKSIKTLLVSTLRSTLMIRKITSWLKNKISFSKNWLTHRWDNIMTLKKHRPIYINFSLRITAKMQIRKMENPKKEDKIKKKEISIMLMIMISTQRTRPRLTLRKEKMRKKRRRESSWNSKEIWFNLKTEEVLLKFWRTFLTQRIKVQWSSIRFTNLSNFAKLFIKRKKVWVKVWFNALMP